MMVHSLKANENDRSLIVKIIDLPSVNNFLPSAEGEYRKNNFIRNKL